jgi:hypothetical protein
MRRLVGCAWRIAAAVALIAASADSAVAQDAGFVVVVSAKNPTSSISKGVLGRIFLKRAPSWPNGEAAVPVDLRGDSPVRKAFSQSVLGRSPDAIRTFWQQAIFTGSAEPPAEKTEREALTFVAKNAGAVAYVSRDATLPAGVKAVALQP